MRLPRSSRGYTLPEVMVSVMIISMVTVALVGLLTQSMRSWGSGMGQENATNNATLAMQKLIRQIRDGRSVQIADGKFQVTYPRVIVDSVTHEQFYDSTGAGDVLSYFVSNGNLVSQQGANNALIVARGVYSVTFTLVRGNLVKIDLESREQTVGKLCAQRVSTRVALRNYRPS